MKISIVGAGAGVGLHALMQALEKGHYVTALSTNLSAMPDHPRLMKINGNATAIEDLKIAIMGADAVLITVGTKKKKDYPIFRCSQDAYSGDTPIAVHRSCVDTNRFWNGRK